MQKIEQETYANPLNRQAIRDHVIKAITKGRANFNHAATLTFPYQVYSRKQAQERLLFFRDKYNAMLGYGIKHYRAVKLDPQLSAPFAAFIEGDGIDKHFHIHLALHKPDSFSDKEFAEMIALLWKDVMHREANTKCSAIYSDGWVEYITKQFGTCETSAYDEYNNIY